ncbi:MAG: S8 family serine peptidase, partial [Anaerolineales bacterium]|nr:S8 family serine peptidase [Anaerolineales bacterium]
MQSVRVSRVLNLVMVVALLLTPLVGFSNNRVQAADPQAADLVTAPVDKIEDLLLSQLATEGQVEFFIWMAEKADLSPAYQMKTKAEKGTFVFNTLRETADRTQQAVRQYLDAQGIAYQSYYIANKIYVAAGSADLVYALAARPDVGRLTANHQYQLQEPFIDPHAPESGEAIESSLIFVKAPDVWALGYDGEGIVLAGNDTGLDWDHPALINQYRGWNGSSVDHNYNWWDATGTYPTVPGDGHGHGTHTTGTMVGDDGGSNQIGMAPGAQTIHCKNMTDSGGGDDGTFTECFQFDLAPWDLTGANPNPLLAPDAVNNSWGYWGGNDPVFEDEIAALQAAGVLIEVSAGNEGSSCATLRSPGDYSAVLTTGSINHAGGTLPGTITGFSSRGPSALYPDDFMPDIMAPGENIRSSVPGGGYQGGWSGTSMAGPHVTGLIALMWDASPALRGDVATTIQAIVDTAVPLAGQSGSNCGGNYTLGPNNDWGYGTFDALAAVQEAISLGGPFTIAIDPL